jgi:hypothetical protein
MEASRSSRGDALVAGGRTLAQLFCIVTGAVLVLVGILGFFSDAGFEAGSNVQGDTFLGLEVNGWHNIVHIASGAFLLLMAGTAATAATGALVFGLVYLVVTIWGFIDDTVLWLVPVNAADNVLHLILALAALAVWAAARSMEAAGHAQRRGERPHPA